MIRNGVEMDFTRAITFVFRERDWIKKIFIEGIISIIPFAGFVHLIGWASEIAKRVSRFDSELIPNPATWKYFSNGIKLLISGLVYYIPWLLITLILKIFSWTWAFVFSGGFEKFGIHLFEFLNDIWNFLYFFLFLFILPVVIQLFLENEKIRETFNFKSVYLRIKRNKQTYVTLFVSLIVSFIIASFGLSIFYIGILFTIPYAAAFFSNLLGQTNQII
jgi:hypothetical protein